MVGEGGGTGVREGRGGGVEDVFFFTLPTFSYHFYLSNANTIRLYTMKVCIMIHGLYNLCKLYSVNRVT